LLNSREGRAALHALLQGFSETARWVRARFQLRPPNWELRDDAHRIEQSLRFRNFREAPAFVREVGELAENEGHHPDISFGWGHATVSLSTKKIKGLQENDFIIASKIDGVFNRRALPLERRQ
jgi:4a-hydroxytetrahydrobiopterin dehydratase